MHLQADFEPNCLDINAADYRFAFHGEVSRCLAFENLTYGTWVIAYAYLVLDGPGMNVLASRFATFATEDDALSFSLRLDEAWQGDLNFANRYQFAREAAADYPPIRWPAP